MTTWPDTERTADRDELADVVGGVIGGEQDGAQIRLVSFAGRNLRGQILRLHGRAVSVPRASARTTRALSAHAFWLGGAGSLGQ